MLKGIAFIVAAVAAGALDAHSVAALPDGWAQEIEQCATNTGMTNISVSVGGAEISVSQSGSFISAEVFAGIGSYVDEYLACINYAGMAPGWFPAAVGQTSDGDGLQAVTFNDAWTILWSFDSDDNVMLIVVTTDRVAVQ